MKHLIQKVAIVFTALLGMASCAENTGMLGINEQLDDISTSQATFSVSTQSIATGAVIASNSNAYLGKVVDPETQSVIEADFAAQFYCHEGYVLPEKKNMVGDVITDPATGDTLKIERGVVQCDSCEVRLFIKSFYGEENNPMKIEVFMLDANNIMEESSSYVTDIDLSQFVDGKEPIATKVFTATDFIVSEAEREGDKYNSNIRIVLPPEIGQQILEKCYAKPQGTQDSYHFIRDIFPGLYFRIANGEGTMICTLVSTLNVFYQYFESKSPNKIYEGVTRFAATPEVIQATHFANGNMDALVNETNYTYLKTPAGICTEMTLPVNEVFDQHPYDSVSLAQITLQRYNKAQNNYQLGTPNSLLMVRKQNIMSFFQNQEVSDNKTSYITNFDKARNSYNFNNICRLLAYCRNEKKISASREGISEAEWESKHPDWNKVVLIPVSTSSNSSGNLTSVTHDMNMNSVKLVGGNTKLKMNVVYSSFRRE
ncbi:MAG: DUF4270 domain-containing protein [Bacteroidaceae bacterium]|nr:DUF4270 domain-containing protein [Bacteroidaceae bacterium]